jgi:AcrR family transcriptional regulator
VSYNDNIALKVIFMPVVVDGAQRRAEVVREATALVMEGGVEALSFRNLARALGCSTTVISHWFRDKNDVLAQTFRHAAAQAHARRDEVLAETGGDLLRAEEEMLPTTEEQRRRWNVWLSFWNAALFDPALAEEHRRGQTATRERLRNHLAARGVEQAGEAATAIVDSLYGIAVQALFDRAYWTPERQVETFRRAVRSALGETAAIPPAIPARP